MPEANSTAGLNSSYSVLVEGSWSESICLANASGLFANVVVGAFLGRDVAEGFSSRSTYSSFRSDSL